MVNMWAMHKKLLYLFIAFVALFGVFAVLSVSADANNGNNAFSIDDDPTLPTCPTYNGAMLTKTAATACNRPVTFLDNMPDALEANTFSDVYRSAGGRYFEVECAHTSAQTICVLGVQVFVGPPPTAPGVTPTVTTVAAPVPSFTG